MTATHLAETTPAAAPPEALADAPARGASLILFLLVLASAISFMDRFIFSLLQEPIRLSLKLSDTSVSLLQGMAFMVFYIIAAVPIGALTDRTRRVGIAGLACLGWSLGTFVCGAARTYGILFLGRVGVGVGEAGLTPSAVSLLSDVYPRRAWSRAVAVFSAGSNLGPAFGYAIGGYVYGLLPRQGLPLPLVGLCAPWQVVFMLAAIPGAVLGLVLLILIKEPARSRSRQTQARGSAFKTLVTAIVGDWRLLRVLAAFCLMAASTVALVAWSPTLFIRVHHWSVRQVGLTFAAMNIGCGLVGMILGGTLSDLLGARGVRAPNIMVILCALVVVAPAVAGFALSGDSGVAFAFLALATFACNLCVGAAVPIVPAVTRPEVRATVVAFYIMLSNLAGVGLAPTGVALLSDWAFKGRGAIGEAVALFVAICTPTAWLLLFFSRNWMTRLSAERAADEVRAS
jgi:MFS family permease